MYIFSYLNQQITYKWKLPVERVHAKPNFEASNSNSIKNEYVKLEPRSKDVFESIDKLITDSSVQVIVKILFYRFHKKILLFK